ncbi:hypothetical protein ACJX0J_034427 [Zea mays]
MEAYNIFDEDNHIVGECFSLIFLYGKIMQLKLIKFCLILFLLLRYQFAYNKVYSETLFLRISRRIGVKRFWNGNSKYSSNVWSHIFHKNKIFVFTPDTNNVGPFKLIEYKI